jgi:tRNA threonylcarbamoyladenosine modification (KEOPS) complex Cgi121 subunit
MVSKNRKSKLSQSCKVGSYHVKILAVNSIKSANVDQLIQEFRAHSPTVKIQGFNSAVVFGKKHIIRVLQLTTELWNRGIRLSKTIETDLLMRLCLTDQISKAIVVGGLKKDQSAYFVLISEDLVSLSNAEKTIMRSCMGKCYPRLKVRRNKMKQFYDKYEIRGNTVNREYIENTLVERAALVHL